MPSYSSWDSIARPFVKGYFELPKAIGRAAIRDGGIAIREAHDQSSAHVHGDDTAKHEHSPLVSVSVQ